LFPNVLLDIIVSYIPKGPHTMYSIYICYLKTNNSYNIGTMWLFDNRKIVIRYYSDNIKIIPIGAIYDSFYKGINRCILKGDHVTIYFKLKKRHNVSLKILQEENRYLTDMYQYYVKKDLLSIKN